MKKALCLLLVCFSAEVSAREPSPVGYTDGQVMKAVREEFEKGGYNLVLLDRHCAEHAAVPETVISNDDTGVRARLCRITDSGEGSVCIAGYPFPRRGKVEITFGDHHVFERVRRAGSLLEFVGRNSTKGVMDEIVLLQLRLKGELNATYSVMGHYIDPTKKADAQMGIHSIACRSSVLASRITPRDR